MSIKEYVVTEIDTNLRVDIVLTNQLSHSRSQIKQWIDKGLIKVNNRSVKANYRCKLNDKVTWSLPKREEIKIKAENIALNIVFEDDHLLIINKAVGMVIHPTNTHQSGTLVNALLHYTNTLSNLGGKERPGIVHRLDKNTAGLLVVAKTNEAHKGLVSQFKANEVKRKYEALVHGVIEHETGIIDAPIGRDPQNRLRMAVVDNGKDARTHFKVIEAYDRYTYIQCKLETGRTHQIRVHMNYINHPIVGDPTYSKINSDYHGQALYARQLGFNHPITGKSMLFEIKQPQFFQDVLQEISIKG